MAINPRRPGHKKSGPDSLSTLEEQLILLTPKEFEPLQRKALPKVPSDLIDMLGLTDVDQTTARAS